MKKSKKLLFFIICLISLNPMVSAASVNSGLPKFPLYKEVAGKFLSTYSITEIGYPQQFSFAKKPDGWHAIITDYLSEEIIKDELYWAKKGGKYLQVSFPAAKKSKINDESRALIDNWQNNYFNSILPYWGYPGWELDVISEFEKKKNNSDTILNALARAYCSYASNLLNNNTGFSSKKQMFKLPKGQNSLSEIQLAEYRKYEHKAIDIYYQLWRQNPEFQTFVADIFNIYSNEVMNSYLTILYHQNKAEAKKEIRSGLYDSFFIDMAKRLLSSCDSNAILIVNGDSDTYPLLYLQETEGFREDVSVVNISMLGSGRYISSLLQMDNEPKPIVCQLDANDYKNDSRPYFYILERKSSISFESLIDFISSGDEDSKIEIEGGFYDFIPTRTVIIDYSTAKPAQTDINSEGETHYSDSTITIELTSNFIPLNHFCLMDIIASNKFKRPVYFAATVQKENFLNLDKYLECEGMAYKISPNNHEGEIDDYETGYLNSNMQYNKLMNLGFSDTVKTQIMPLEIHKMLTQNYLSIYSRLIRKLISENKTDSALLVLTYCSENFLKQKQFHGYFSLSIIESYYKINHIKEADLLARDLSENTLVLLNNINPSTPNYDYVKMLITEIFKQVKDLTGIYSEDTSLNQYTIDNFNNTIQKFK